MKTNKKVFFLLLATVATFVLLTSCACKMNHKGASLEEVAGDWQVTHINGNKFLGEEPMTINFDIKEMRIGGKAICNSYGAPFTLKTSGTIKIKDVFSTLVGCPGNGFETEYYALLESITYIYIKGQEAFLYKDKNDKQPVIVLKR